MTHGPRQRAGSGAFRRRPATGRGRLAGLLLLPLLAAASPREEQIVIVANRNVKASVELAGYYARQRGIATNRICLVDLPAGEVLARRYYENNLRDPFLRFLREGGFVQQVQREKTAVQPHDSGWKTVKSDVRFVALMHGVPLRIEDARGSLGRKVAQVLNAPMTRDDAAVDSELALALFESYDIAGRVPNFLQGQVQWEDLGAGAKDLLLVARLDGPDPAVVRRMIDDALHAERHGLWGRAYFDTRGLRDTSYLVGDFWLREAAHRFEREGWWVQMDAAEPVWGAGFPMEQCAVYMGWYAEHCVGPFARTNFAFARGAFAYHNHSANAKTLRTATNYWCGPLLARGACCTMGATAEPYLGLTPDLQVFADRWLAGRTFAEAAYMALPALSWQTTVIGDPLYRPFGRSLDADIARLDAAGDRDAEWAWLLAANRLVLQGRFNIAMNVLRSALKKRDSAVLHERRADLYLANDLFAEAAREYDAVIAAAPSPETAFRAANKDVLMLRLLNRDGEAGKVAETVRQKWPGSVYDGLLDAKP